MKTMTANEAKTQFGDMLLKVQQAPVQISRNGKPVAVVVSADDYQALEVLKLQQLKNQIILAEADIAAGNTVEGEDFMQALIKGEHD